MLIFLIQTLICIEKPLKATFLKLLVTHGFNSAVTIRNLLIVQTKNISLSVV